MQIQDLNRSFLTLVIHCHYSQDESTLSRLNISTDTAQRIAKLPSNVRYKLESQLTPFIDMHLDESAINSAINSCYASSSRDDNYNKAIRLGAAKSTMHHVCRMSSAEFANRRRILNISDSRVRPKILTPEEECSLAKLYREKPQLNKLETLIFLSEKSDIDINRIYTYFLESVE